jgi:hypothetical protein
VLVLLRADFVIKCRPGGRVSVRGRIAKAKMGAIKQFFAQDLGSPHRVTVRGTFGPGRSLRLRVFGRLSAAQRQRMRNFLVAHLR